MNLIRVRNYSNRLENTFGDDRVIIDRVGVRDPNEFYGRVTLSLLGKDVIVPAHRKFSPGMNFCLPYLFVDVPEKVVREEVNRMVTRDYFLMSGGGSAENVAGKVNLDFAAHYGKVIGIDILANLLSPKLDQIKAVKRSREGHLLIKPTKQPNFGTSETRL